MSDKHFDDCVKCNCYLFLHSLIKILMSLSYVFTSLLTMGFDTNVCVLVHMLNGTPQAVTQTIDIN